ncbi:MAG: hypothetical protein GEU86_15535 [Actinophytocola sp.]|nr:hypothetical protein [Actinophytocola sp.]
MSFGFTGHALGGGSVGVVLPAAEAQRFRAMLERFVTELERGIHRKGRLRWSRSWDRMFPGPHTEYRLRKEFRLAHAVGMRQTLQDAARRILQRFPDHQEIALDPESVADWFMVCGHAQSLFVTKRWGAKPLQGTFGRGDLEWLVQMRELLAGAALDFYVYEHLEPGDVRF